MADGIDIEPLELAFEDMAREEAMELAGRWFSAATEHLIDAGTDRDYDVAPVAQSGVPPQWTGDVAEFKFIHPAARYFNDGTEHTEPITPVDAEVLAFPWPDAPPAVREMFEDTFPIVFLPETTPDGIDALRFMEKGRGDARRGMGR